MYLDNSRAYIEMQDKRFPRRNRNLEKWREDKNRPNSYFELEALKTETYKKKIVEMNNSTLMVNNYKDFVFEAHRN